MDRFSQNEYLSLFLIGISSAVLAFGVSGSTDVSTWVVVGNGIVVNVGIAVAIILVIKAWDPSWYHSA